MTTGTISIVLATHNGEKFLPQQLKSLLAQTHPATEIVISDDNSSDRTLEIMNQFADRSAVPVVRIQNVPGLGFRENFIQASLRASGDWIAFCDQDDVWMPNKLETCAQYLDDPSITQIVHSAQLIDADNRAIGAFTQGIASTRVRPPLDFDVWRTFFGFSMVFRRELLQVVAPELRFVDYVAPEHRIAHDRWVFFLAQVLGKTAEIATPLVQYRQHDQNLFGARNVLKYEDRATRRETHRAYVEATSAMLRIVETMPRPAEDLFPAYRREAAIKVFRAAYSQVCARDSVYRAGRRQGFARVLSNLVTGSYQNVHNGTLRWRSVARDVLYCTSK